MDGEFHKRTETPEAKPSLLEGFRQITSELGTTFEDAKAFVCDLFEQEDDHYVPYGERLGYTPLADTEKGTWKGERGESKFIPSDRTSAGRDAKEKLAEYGLRGITYKDAEPDFSKCAEATVKIDNMTENRYRNFFQADIICAKLWSQEAKDGRTDWTPRAVENWRDKNQFSWHERCDTKTMDLVPQEIHSFCRHSGGVAECKARDAADIGGGFDE